MKPLKSKPSQPFAEAVRTGDFALLRKALAEGANPNQLVDGERPLLRPILGFTDALVKAGADVNVQDKRGSNILHLLIPMAQEGSASYESLVKLIASKMRSVDAQNSDGMSPLMVACKFGRLASVRLLLDLGASVNLINPQNGHSALFDAIGSSSVTRNSDKIILLLLQKGANLNLYDSELGWSPLMSATFMNRKEQVRLLLQHGADPRAKSRGINGYPVETALDIAERMGYAELIDIIRDHQS